MQINVLWQLVQLLLNIKLMMVEIYTICYLLWRRRFFKIEAMAGFKPNDPTKYYRLFHTHDINFHTIYSKFIMLCQTIYVQCYINISVVTIDMKDSNIGFIMNCELWIIYL